MTNAELKKELTTVRNDTHKLRERISTLTDEIASLRGDLKATKQLVSQDMQVLVSEMQKRRIL